MVFIDWSDATVIAATKAEAEVGTEVVAIVGENDIARLPTYSGSVAMHGKNTTVCRRYLPRYFVVVGLGMLFEDIMPNVLILTVKELGSINRFSLHFSAHLGFERPLCTKGICNAFLS